MVLIGCKPPGRHTEQHDVYFGIAETIKDLVPGINRFWPEAVGKIHVDGWRAVEHVSGYTVSIVPRNGVASIQSHAQLFFINLGGYKQGEFEEFHYKILVAGSDKGAAIRQAKDTAFYQHTGFPGATSHVDDKYGIDVDDIHQIEEVLPEPWKEDYAIVLTPATDMREDNIQLGYMMLDKL